MQDNQRNNVTCASVTPLIRPILLAIEAAPPSFQLEEQERRWAEYLARAAASAEELRVALQSAPGFPIPLSTGPPPAGAKPSWAALARRVAPEPCIPIPRKDLSYQRKRAHDAYVLRKAARVQRERIARWHKSLCRWSPKTRPPTRQWQVSYLKTRSKIIQEQVQLEEIGEILPVYNRFQALYTDCPEISIIPRETRRRKHRKPRRGGCFRSTRTPRVKRRPVAPCRETIPVRGHMADREEGAHQAPAASNDGSDNVVIQSTTEMSEAVPTPAPNLIKRLCASTTQTDFSAVSMRATVGAPFEWKSSMGVGHVIKRYKLPYDFVRSYRTHPQMAGFQFSQYWRGDMVVMLTLAANPMVTGMCQVAWFYAKDSDAYSAYREHPVSYSMTNHVLLNASTANDVKLRIPYKSIRSFVQTTATTSTQIQDQPLYVGELIISVLNPLGIPAGCTPRVMITPQIWFEKSDFIGMKSNTYGTPVTGQSPIEIAKMIYRMYQVYQDYNRDKELNPANPAAVVQRFGNLATGTGQNENIQPMRLHAGAQTTHPELAVDQMRVDYVKNIFGFLKTIRWKSTQNEGDICAQLAAAPLDAFSSYPTRVVGGQDVYYIPPVALLATMYREWRGSLELRGDIIATKFHVGKLMISYLPFHTGDNVIPTKDQLRAGLVYVVALSDGNAQFNVSIPYIFDTPFCATPDQGVYDTSIRPGNIYISVLTPLSTTCVVYPDVDINLYLRGGGDFEVAIPRTPSVGLCWDTSIAKGDIPHELKARSGYYPMYLGDWHNLESGQGLIWRWGTLSDRVGQFDGADAGYIYKFHANDLKSLTSVTVSVDGKTLKAVDLWYVPFSDNDGYGYVYVAACATEEKAISVWASKDTAGNWVPRGKKEGSTWVWAPDYTNVLKGMIEDGTWTPNDYRLRLTGTAIPNFPKLIECFVDDSFVIIGHVTNEREADIALMQGQTIGPQRGSLLQFGEDHHDLKDLVRRYYFQGQYNSSDKYSSSAKFVVPIVPRGVIIDPANSVTDNYFRDGLYTVIASQYRFFRGGMRVKLAFNCKRPLTVEVAHRPDFIAKDGMPSARSGKPMAETPVYVSETPRGFAQTFTLTSYNPCIEIEIPYYLRTERGLLQESGGDMCSNQAWLASFLGSLVVTVPTYGLLASEVVSMRVYIGAADDMRFDEYQGHPPVFPIRATGVFEQSV